MEVIKQLITPGRTRSRCPGSSKKKVFEAAARLISQDQLSLSESEVFSALFAREKLGSTGLGKGIAIPHCRISNCTHAVGALLTMEQPVDFDAPDGQPVDILFILLVPEGANEEHLKILSGLARRLNDDAYCAALRACDSDDALFHKATEESAN